MPDYPLPANSSTTGILSPTGTLSQRLRLLLALVHVVLTGCSVGPPRSQVVARQIQPLDGQRVSWLESATVTYARHEQSLRPDGSMTASFAEPVRTEGGLRVLGIRYPHPNGDKDVARVELVIADSRAAPKESSWRRSLGKGLNNALPGVAWGDGILQAKAIDLPLAELQQLLATTQSSKNGATFSRRSSQQAQLLLEINGQRSRTATPPVSVLEDLADRVLQQGRLITYKGTAEDLQASFVLPRTNQLVGAGTFSTVHEHKRAEVASHAELVPLPPVSDE